MVLGPGRATTPTLNVHAKAVTKGQKGGHEDNYEGGVNEKDGGRQSSPALGWGLFIY